jgi:hypothetical protein
MSLRLQLMAMCLLRERDEFRLRAPIPLEREPVTPPVRRAVDCLPGSYEPRQEGATQARARSGAGPARLPGRLLDGLV